MIRKIFVILKKVVVGVVKGAAETTIIPSIVREVKTLKSASLAKLLDRNGDGKINLADVKDLAMYLDVNGDGKVDLADIQQLRWETLGKLVVLFASLAGLLYAVFRFAPGLLIL